MPSGWIENFIGGGAIPAVRSIGGRLGLGTCWVALNSSLPINIPPIIPHFVPLGIGLVGSYSCQVMNTILIFSEWTIEF